MRGDHAGERPRRRLPLVLGAIVLAAVASVLGYAALADDGVSSADSGSRADTAPGTDTAPSAGPTATASPPAQDVEAEPARLAASVVRPEAPRVVRLPDGTGVPVDAVSTRRSGVLDVPDDVERAGWWKGGSRLGDPFGATLLAGHVDSRTQGLGVFSDVLSLKAGQRLVLRSKHLAQTFEIDSLDLVRRSKIGTRTGLYSARGDRRLVLVTCAPPYDRGAGGYQNLAVVTASPTQTVHRRASERSGGE